MAQAFDDDTWNKPLVGKVRRLPANDARPVSEVVPGPGALTTVGADTIFAPLPPLPYLVQGLHIAPGRPCLVAGYGYSGKTVALQSMALSVATGKPVWGVYGARRGKVLHLDWEQGARLSFRRYQRLAAGMGVSRDDVGDGLHAAVYPVLRIDDAGAEEALTRACEGFDMVICDSFTAATGQVEENSSEAGRPLYMLGRISDATGATIIIVHHARKPSKDAAGGAKMSIRGSGAIFGASDSVFIFSAEKGEPVRVSHERSPSDGQHLADFGLAIEDVEVGDDPYGGLRVVHQEGEQLPVPGKSSSEERKRAEHQDMIRAFFRTSGPVFEGGAKNLRDTVGINREAFGRAFEPMKQAGEIAVSGTYHRPVLTWRGEPS